MSNGQADKALYSQLAGNPQGLYMVSGATAGVIGLLPGMPLIPFALMAAGAIGLGLTANRKSNEAEAAITAKTVQAGAETEAAEPPIGETLALDELKIELGYGLLPLINDVEGRKLTDQIRALRRSLAEEMGFVTPSVRIIDNMRLGSNDYTIRVKEMEAGNGAGEAESICWSWTRTACRSTCPATMSRNRPLVCPRPGLTRICARKPPSAAIRLSIRQQFW